MSKFKLYTFKRPQRAGHFPQQFSQINSLPEARIVDDDLTIRQLAVDQLESFASLPDKEEAQDILRKYTTFLPPRLVAAAKIGSLVPFFGSGLSISAGIPTWNSLLEALGISKDYITDPHLENDPLTQAELIAHQIGHDVLQGKLRNIINLASRPSLAHYLLCLFRLPVYLTTNYDTLFEQAWEAIWKEKLDIIINDLDVDRLLPNKTTRLPSTKKSLLIKMHGDANRDDEHLILTRSDYRRHYRTNIKVFQLVKDILQSGYILFLGFGHRDPEVSRLVEDVVYRYEEPGDVTKKRAPTLYSIQFDMRQRTPEVFAARGMVALRPPTIVRDLTANQLRSAALNVALGELLAAMDNSAHETLDLQQILAKSSESLSTALESAMTSLGNRKSKITSLLQQPTKLQRELKPLVKELGQLAGQGIYVAYSDGDIAAMAVPEGLNANERNTRKNFANRPYFRQAHTFRHAFVSDIAPSIYNGHGTVFLCVPLGEQHSFEGLLFAAAQPGAWDLPVTLRDELWPEVEFLLIDSNGIALIPPTFELKPEAPAVLPQGELPEHNKGFKYTRLEQISRRDNHLAHIVQNVVPVGWDDDVHDVSPELRFFSMVAEVRGTRWKLALSRSVPTTLATTGR